MRGRGVRAAVLGLVALAGLVAAYIAATLPPPAIRLDGPPPPPAFVVGAYHVHSARSDGAGSVDAIARAASRAGLQFVILTDHGDATRAPDPPAYRHGVLVIDAVEIGTGDGHLVALGLSAPAPYPLAGDAADVIADVHRLGGWVVAAHPDSPDAELRWRARSVEVDGLEWLSADSEWRDEPAGHLLAAALRALVRGPEALAALVDRPARSLDRWDGLARQRPVVGLAALDVHGRALGWQEGAESGGGLTVIAWPGYELMFRTVAQGVQLETPFTGDAAADAARLLAALRAGRTQSIVTALAAPAALHFTAEQDGRQFGPGDRLEAGQPVTLRAEVPQAPGAVVALLHNGERIATGRGRIEHPGRAGRGAYRVEVELPARPVPWIVSNPIYAGVRAPAPSPPPVDPAGEVVALDGLDWSTEHDPTSSVALGSEAEERRLQFTLGPGRPAGQYVAAVVPVEGESGFDRLRFRGRADRPMRMSVQLRLPGGRDGLRWRHSVYLDERPRDVVLRLQDFQPVGQPSSQRPIVARVRSVLFVVDTLNTPTGARGAIWVSGAALLVGRVDGGS